VSRANAMQLTTRRRRLLQGVLLLLWASGTGWLIAHHWLTRQGEYGPEISPVEPWALRLHGLMALATTAFLGLLWAVHIVRGWTAKRRRGSGGVLFAGAMLLLATGYLLYYASDDNLRGWVSIVHWSLGLVSLPLFLVHRIGRGHPR